MNSDSDEKDSYGDDESGDIDVKELRQALNHLGIQTSSSQAEKVMLKYDKDGSGELDFEEFTRCIREVRKRHFLSTFYIKMSIMPSFMVFHRKYSDIFFCCFQF